MDAGFFEQKLKKHPIFERLKNSLPKNSNRLRNLIELRDDVFYAWDCDENCLLSVNLKHLEENEGDGSYQKLHLLQAPSFEVDRLEIGACGSRICVWGARGATVVELPTRWGRAGLFDGGKDTVLCKSHALDERFLFSQGEVRRVRWHPTSLSHVLVLVSDNTMRIYNIALKSGPKLLKSFSVGPRPTSVLSGRAVLESLGDTAVDFHAMKDDRILLLTGAGDLYCVTCSLEDMGPYPPRVVGPLSMSPPADDNYGSESCALALLPSEPPLVVIATSCAVIYHALLLPDTENSSDCDLALYVIESVELDISLNPDEAIQSYPVHLYPLSSSSGSYVVSHCGGLHTLSVGIVGALKEYMEVTQEEIDTSLSTVMSRRSKARYTLATGTNAGSKPSPVQGVAVCAGPNGALLALTQNGQLVVRNLQQYDLEEELYKELKLKHPSLDSDDITKILKERQKLSFSSIIAELLNRDVSQPILLSEGKLKPNTKETLEFLTQATLKLSTEYIARQARAAEAIQKKIKSLTSLGNQQQQWFNSLRKEIDDVQLENTVLKEKLGIAKKNQKEIQLKCSSIIRALRSSLPPSASESSMLKELQEFRDKLDEYMQQIGRLKDRASEKKDTLEKRCDEYKKKNIALGTSHSDTISSILQQQTAQVSTIISDTKHLKEQLGII